MSEDLAESLNQRRGGFNEALGLRFVRATQEEVIGRLEIGPEHLQPYGVVHGGVYASMIETVASVGAALNVMPEGRYTVGVENSTAFLRATRSGHLSARATPLSRGRRSHVWTVEVRDEGERLVATGRVRMLCLEAGARLGGETVELS